MESQNEKRLMTINQVADLLSLSKFAVYNMVYSDRIPYIKVGRTNRSIRFDRQKIEMWLSKQSNYKILSRK